MIGEYRVIRVKNVKVATYRRSKVKIRRIENEKSRTLHTDTECKKKDELYSPQVCCQDQIVPLCCRISNSSTCDL